MNPLFPRRAMYVEGNIEARSRKHCYSGKAISITYSEFVSVALVIQHAIRMVPYYTVARDLSGCKGFHKVIEHKKVCFDFLHTFCLKHFSF
jgi:hypothetical protein